MQEEVRKHRVIMFVLFWGLLLLLVFVYFFFGWF